MGGHTLRGCVDWNSSCHTITIGPFVTPCVGVWIETNEDDPNYIENSNVTPCVGVWIETPYKYGGLIIFRVTPCVGVWIETPGCHARECAAGHTLRGCVDWNMRRERDTVKSKESHPAWVCGLKPYKIRAWFLLFVTPCVGVWIETHQDRLMSGMRSHTLRGCVDWNSNTLIQLQGDTKSHPAWVCGLKRLLGHSNGFSQPVTPCVGVWIETKIQVWGWSGIESHTLRGCVDWNVSVEKSKTL